MPPVTENMSFTVPTQPLMETLSANCILAEDTVVGTASDVIARAYRTRHFVKENLIIAAGAEITDADKEALRDVGILLSSAIKV